MGDGSTHVSSYTRAISQLAPRRIAELTSPSASSSESAGSDTTFARACTASAVSSTEGAPPAYPLQPPLDCALSSQSVARDNACATFLRGPEFQSPASSSARQWTTRLVP